MPTALLIAILAQWYTVRWDEATVPCRSVFDAPLFAACLSGPNEPAIEACRLRCDCDGDGDVDLRDYAEVLR